MEGWLADTGHVRGFSTTNQVMYDLSRDWYAGRMDADWEPPDPEAAEALVARHGLRGEFWRFRPG